MVFESLINKEQLKNYVKLLQAVCSLSKLFSESNIPYLYYRVAENIFCKSFNANNLSRDDLAYDAKIGNTGIGLKTFTSPSDKTNEKISEFNSFSQNLVKLKSFDLACRLSELRNERISFANRTYGISNSLYHCIARKEKQILIFNSTYDIINYEKIKNVKNTKAGIQFEDDKNEYSFNYSKSTLYKKFYTPDDALKINIKVIDDPFDIILQILTLTPLERPKFEIAGKDFVILPLYSLKESKRGEKIVSKKSGLNQWNAGGRKRDIGEVYIPIPAQIHNNFPDFFPSRDKNFELHIPTGEILSAKVCQQNSKALMTNPNNALSDWLLRKVLKLKEGELLDNNRLNILGIDSVRITKHSTHDYFINFAKIDSYDDFAKFMN